MTAKPWTSATDRLVRGLEHPLTAATAGRYHRGVSWHAVHRPRLFRNPSAVDEQLRHQPRNDADRLLAEAAAVLLAIDDPPQD